MNTTGIQKSLNSIPGISITKHFIERYFERFNDPQVLFKVLKYLNSNLCVLLYETVLTDNAVDLNIEGFVVPVVYSEIKGVPTLVCKTLYKKGS